MAERGYQYKAAQGLAAKAIRTEEQAAALAQAGGPLPSTPPAIYLDRLTKEERRIWRWIHTNCDWLSVEDSPLVYEFCNVERLLVDCRRQLDKFVQGGPTNKAVSDWVVKVRVFENSLSQRHFALSGEIGVTPLARTRLLQFQQRGKASTEVDAAAALKAKYLK